MKPVATPAKDLDDTGIARQLSHAQLLESLHGSMNCLPGVSNRRYAASQGSGSAVSAMPTALSTCFVLFESDRLANYVGVRERRNLLYLLGHFRPY